MRSSLITPDRTLSNSSRRGRKSGGLRSNRPDAPGRAAGRPRRPDYVDNVVDLEAARRERRLRRAERAERMARVSAPLPPEAAKAAVARVEPAPPAAEATAAPPGGKAACPPCHWGLIVLTLLLVALSIPVIYSASTANALEYQKDADYFFWRQLLFAGVGTIVLWGASRLSMRATRNWLWILYFASIAGLIAIEFTPGGVTMGGGQRWLKLGPIPIQVSELAKIALIGVLADFWSRAAPTSQKSWWPWVAAFFITAPVAGLVFIQPHLSATLLLVMTPFILALYAPVPGRQWFRIVTPLVALALVTVLLARSHHVPFLKPYQQDRIAAFFPSGDGVDARGANYQQLQGLRALRRGGVLGVGPGASLYKQGHLPAPHTDFILAIFGEEWGMVGMLALLTLYGLLIFFCMQIGVNANTGFEALLCAGVGSLLGVQLVCNTGIVTGLLPVTGMPLPLLSYGGSGLVCTLFGLGLVLAVSRRSGGALAATTVKSAEE